MNKIIKFESRNNQNEKTKNREDILLDLDKGYPIVTLDLIKFIQLLEQSNKYKK